MSTESEAMAAQLTVTWVKELAPSVEAREAAMALFERQTGHPPVKLYMDPELRVWGFMDPDAAMLFKIPDGWTP